MKKPTICALLLCGSLATIATAKWSRLAGTENNMANMSSISAGTSVQDAEGIKQSAALILDDPLRPISISGGKSEATLKFVKQAVVKRASFASDGLEGKVSASVSADGKAWSSATSSVFSAADRLVALNFGAAQGRYLRLEFELVRGGTIRAFQVLGSDVASQYEVTQNGDNTGPKVNFAGAAGGGRLIYVNPQSYGSRNDELEMNQITFPESEEKYRTAVYDLGQVRSLDEFGSVHSQRPVRLSVYAFETLPENEDWRGRLAFDPTVFDTMEPVATAEDTKGSGAIKVRPGGTVKARYIAMRWEPDFNPPNFVVGAVAVLGQGGSFKKDGDTAVETSQDANGNTVATVTQGGESMTVTANPSTGAVTTSGSISGGTTSNGGGTGQGTQTADGQLPGPITVHNPLTTTSGTGTNSPPKGKGPSKKKK